MEHASSLPQWWWQGFLYGKGYARSWSLSELARNCGQACRGANVALTA